MSLLCLYKALKNKIRTFVLFFTCVYTTRCDFEGLVFLHNLCSYFACILFMKNEFDLNRACYVNYDKLYNLQQRVGDR